MLSAIGRAAVRRVVAGGAQSKNQALRSIWHIQRVDFIQDPSNTSKFALPIQRLYATATKAAPGTKVKKSATKAKPKAKKPAPKKKAVKKAAKKVVKKKSKPVKKVKKPLTEMQKSKLVATKARAHLKELKEQALSPPSKPATTAWQVLLSEVTKQPQPAGQKYNLATIAKEASARFKSLTPAEIEAYNHTAIQSNAQKEVALKKWVESHTPDQIRIANNARAQLRAKSKTKKSWTPIQDERRPKTAISAYFYFSKEKRASGELKGISFVDSTKLLADEWRSLSPSQKKPYEDLAKADNLRYHQEYKTVYPTAPATLKA